MKKRHGHKNEFWTLTWNQRVNTHIWPKLILYHNPKLFFCTVTPLLTKNGILVQLDAKPNGFVMVIMQNIRMIP